LTLIDLKKGEEGIIRDFIGESMHLIRLREMGLSKGTVLKVIRFAPLGDPIEIKLRGFHLSLRKDLAKNIIVEKKEKS
jgi:Fe2+ transport system protein FeoA